MSPNPKSGFSLIELLTSTIVIAILVSLLCPLIAMLRDQARSIRCVSNVRQLTMAALSWGQDNQGRVLPYRNESATTWKTLINDYVGSNLSGSQQNPDKAGGSILQDCPAWRGRWAGDGGYGLGAKGQGYMLNTFPGRTGDNWWAGTAGDWSRSSGFYWDYGHWYRFGAITFPSKRIMFSDGDLHDEEWDPVPSRWVVSNVRYGGNRHSRGSSWAFFDGRAGAFKHDEMKLWQNQTTITSRPEYWVQWNGTWKNKQLWNALFNPGASPY
jgi:prepilin-type N-terminal cleavage/methylation domain-containing protein